MNDQSARVKNTNYGTLLRLKTLFHKIYVEEYLSHRFVYRFKSYPLIFIEIKIFHLRLQTETYAPHKKTIQIKNIIH